MKKSPIFLFLLINIAKLSPLFTMEEQTPSNRAPINPQALIEQIRHLRESGESYLSILPEELNEQILSYINQIKKNTHALYATVIAGNDIHVKELLQKNPYINVNIQDNFGETPLIWAAKKNYVSIVKLLLGAGADKSIQDHYGRTALMWAQSNKNKELISLLA